MLISVIWTSTFPVAVILLSALGWCGSWMLNSCLDAISSHLCKPLFEDQLPTLQRYSVDKPPAILHMHQLSPGPSSHEMTLHNRHECMTKAAQAISWVQKSEAEVAMFCFSGIQRKDQPSFWCSHPFVFWLPTECTHPFCSTPGTGIIWHELGILYLLPSI